MPIMPGFRHAHKLIRVVLFSTIALLLSVFYGPFVSFSGQGLRSKSLPLRPEQSLDVPNRILQDTHVNFNPPSQTRYSKDQSNIALKTSTAEHFHKHRIQNSLVKRDDEERDGAVDFDQAKCKGQELLARYQSVLDNNGPFPQVFPFSALDNGWTLENYESDIGNAWQTYFDKQLGKGKIPPKDQIRFITADQDLDFINSQGVETEPAVGRADFGIYNQQYIPALRAVIVRNMASPQNRWKKWYRGPAGQMPSDDEIAAQHVPPLNRWSDVTWTIYQDVSKGQNTPQYICHHWVTTPVTKSVFEYINETYRDPSDGSRFPQDFPGREFGMDTPEGQALLGTPNGYGTARMMMDRARELGKRNPKVRIWFDDGFKMMAWNLVPV